MIKRPLIVSLLYVLGYAISAHAGQIINISESISPQGVVEIDIYAGEVDIQGWDKPEIKIIGELASEKDELLLDIRRQTTSIALKESARKKNTNAKSYLTIYIPMHRQVEGKFVSANVKSTDVFGGLHMESVNGSIKVKNAKKDIEIKTVSGAIHLVSSDGDIEIRSISGTIKSRENRGAIKINSVSGDIHADVSFERKVQINSTSGSINSELTPTDASQIKINTFSGNINATLKGTVHAYVELLAGSKGGIQRNNKVENGQQKEESEKNTVLNFGEAGSRILLRTLSGIINLNDRNCSTCGYSEHDNIISDHTLIPDNPVALKLPRKSAKLKIIANMELPVDEINVPYIEVTFFDKAKRDLFRKTISDHQCTGEYEAKIGYMKDKSGHSWHYLKSKLPWPDDLNIGIETNVRKDGKYYQIINYLDENVEIPLYKPVRSVELSVYNGIANIERITLIK